MFRENPYEHLHLPATTLPRQLTFLHFFLGIMHAATELSPLERFGLIRAAEASAAGFAARPQKVYPEMIAASTAGLDTLDKLFYLSERTDRGAPYHIMWVVGEPSAVPPVEPFVNYFDWCCREIVRVSGVADATAYNSLTTFTERFQSELDQFGLNAELSGSRECPHAEPGAKNMHAHISSARGTRVYELPAIRSGYLEEDLRALFPDPELYKVHVSEPFFYRFLDPVKQFIAIRVKDCVEYAPPAGWEGVNGTLL